MLSLARCAKKDRIGIHIFISWMNIFIGYHISLNAYSNVYYKNYDSNIIEKYQLKIKDVKDVEDVEDPFIDDKPLNAVNM
jgi:hypothetical protein